jgi:hypothetical protein
MSIQRQARNEESKGKGFGRTHLRSSDIKCATRDSFQRTPIANNQIMVWFGKANQNVGEKIAIRCESPFPGFDSRCEQSRNEEG